MVANVSTNCGNKCNQLFSSIFFHFYLIWFDFYLFIFFCYFYYYFCLVFVLATIKVSKPTIIYRSTYCIPIHSYVHKCLLFSYFGQSVLPWWRNDNPQQQKLPTKYDMRRDVTKFEWLNGSISAWRYILVCINIHTYILACLIAL